MERLTTAQKVNRWEAGRDLASMGVVSVVEAPHRVGGWFAILGDGTRVHSDHIQVRMHNTLDAIAKAAA